MDNIYTALSGHRIFDRFGFNLPSTNTESEIRIIFNYDEWDYNTILSDWVNSEPGDHLVSYNPSEELISILDNNIDSITA